MNNFLSVFLYRSINNNNIRYNIYLFLKYFHYSLTLLETLTIIPLGAVQTSKKKLQPINIENVPNKVKTFMINIHSSNCIDDKIVKYKRNITYSKLKGTIVKHFHYN